jgi:hypothetical protein
LVGSCCNNIALPIDNAACQAGLQETIDELSRDGTAYDGAAAAACMNGYGAALARCVLPSDDAIRSCEAVYIGTVPVGGACVSEGECAGDAFCAPDATGAFVCTSDAFAAPLPAVEGEACAGSCEDGSEPCLVVGLPGGTPAEPKVCYASDGLVCDFGTGVTGVCVRTPGIGQPCNSYCVAGAYCDFELLQCVATLRDGEICEYAEQCQSRLCGNARCGSEEMLGADVCNDF